MRSPGLYGKPGSWVVTLLWVCWEAIGEQRTRGILWYDECFKMITLALTCENRVESGKPAGSLLW